MTPSDDLYRRLRGAFTLGDILNTAIEFEQASFDYYCLWAEKLHGELQALLVALAEEELRHCDLLLGLRDQMEQANRLTEQPINRPTGEEFGGFFQLSELDEGNVTREAIVRVAAAREQMAQEQYQMLALELDEGPAKELFSYLAKEESAHRMELGRLFHMPEIGNHD